MTTQGSSVVILNDEEQVLLIFREDLRIWALPGGGLEPDETFTQAAVREVREETGYHIELLHKVGIYWRPQYPNGSNELHVFLGKIIDANMIDHDWESLAVQWFDLDALPKRLFKFAREHIEDARKVTNIPIEREQTLPTYQAIIMKILVIIRNMRNRIVHRTHRQG